MSPFEPVKDELIIPRNVWTPLGNGHVGGTPTRLTGFDYDRRAVSAGGVSADQIAGRHVGQETLPPSLKLSTKGEGFFSNSLSCNSISWSARIGAAARGEAARRLRPHLPASVRRGDRPVGNGRGTRRREGHADGGRLPVGRRNSTTPMHEIDA